MGKPIPYKEGGKRNDPHSLDTEHSDTEHRQECLCHL